MMRMWKMKKECSLALNHTLITRDGRESSHRNALQASICTSRDCLVPHVHSGRGHQVIIIPWELPWLSPSSLHRTHLRSIPSVHIVHPSPALYAHSPIDPFLTPRFPRSTFNLLKQADHRLDWPSLLRLALISDIGNGYAHLLKSDERSEPSLNTFFSSSTPEPSDPTTHSNILLTQTVHQPLTSLNFRINRPILTNSSKYNPINSRGLVRNLNLTSPSPHTQPMGSYSHPLPLQWSKHKLVFLPGFKSHLIPQTLARCTLNNLTLPSITTRSPIFPLHILSHLLVTRWWDPHSNKWHNTWWTHRLTCDLNECFSSNSRSNNISSKFKDTRRFCRSPNHLIA